jgi:hypothetical protein
LKRTTPLYIQLMIAFYTTTTLGSIKLREMLQLLPHERVNNIVELDSIANLFANKTGDNVYILSLSILVTLVREY